MSKQEKPPLEPDAIYNEIVRLGGEEDTQLQGTQMRIRDLFFYPPITSGGRWDLYIPSYQEDDNDSDTYSMIMLGSVSTVEDVSRACEILWWWSKSDGVLPPSIAKARKPTP